MGSLERRRSGRSRAGRRTCIDAAGVAARSLRGDMFEFLGKTVLVIFLIGLAVVIALLALIF